MEEGSSSSSEEYEETSSEEDSDLEGLDETLDHVYLKRSKHCYILYLREGGGFYRHKHKGGTVSCGGLGEDQMEEEVNKKLRKGYRHMPMSQNKLRGAYIFRHGKGAKRSREGLANFIMMAASLMPGSRDQKSATAEAMAFSCCVS